MNKISLVFRKKDCMGCHACEVACKQEHALGVGPRLVRVLEKSPDYVPIYCHHCAKAPCKEACPVEAISRNEQGIVLNCRKVRSLHSPVGRRQNAGLYECLPDRLYPFWQQEERCGCF